MKKLNICLGIVAASLMAACSNDMDRDDQYNEALVPLSVKTQMPTTRAAIGDTSFSEGDQVGLFLPNYGTAYLNVPATWTSGMLKTQDIILGSQTSKVYAYYPYQEIDPTLMAIPVNVADQVNFLYGVSEKEVYNKAPETTIPFQHAMARVCFNVTYKEGAQLTQIAMYGDGIYQQGYFTIVDEVPTVLNNPSTQTTAESPLTFKIAKASKDKTVTHDVLLLPGNGGMAKLLFTYDNGKTFDFDVKIPAQEGGQMYTMNIVIKEDPYNGHPYVDLGLSSGLLWSTINLGATDETAYGSYVAWSETDAAYAAWKGVWRMPTTADMQELLDECDWTWSKSGFTVTSKNNGNSIFLPAGGIQDDKGTVTHDGTYGFYLTSMAEDGYVFELSFYNEVWGKAYYIGSIPVNYSCSVRPVAPKVKE